MSLLSRGPAAGPVERAAAAGGPPGRPGAGPEGDSWLSALLSRCCFPPPSEGPVTLAVSGGADSTALMVLARLAGLQGTVVHVDHGLRAGSGEEAQIVEAGARRLGFAFSSVQVTLEDGPDLEARARRARYGVLPRGVLTGHTMDDQAETVLLNLLRGAALDGLSGMRQGAAVPAHTPPFLAEGPGATAVGPGAVTGGPVVRRPLLGVRRAETVEVCRRAGLETLVDPSNADPRFRRNRVRADLLPLLDLIAERDMVPVLARQAEAAADDVELLEQLSAGLDPTDVAGLRAAPPALARRALRAWLRSGSGHHPPSSAELARVMDVVEGRYRACQISGGRRVSRRSGRLSLSEPDQAGRAVGG